MEKVMMYTGGNAILMIMAAFFALIMAIMGTTMVIIGIIKNQTFDKIKKIEFVALIIIVFLIVMWIGCIIGYYYCMNQML